MCLAKKRDNMMMVTLGRQNCVLFEEEIIYVMVFFITSLHSGCLAHLNNDVTLMTSNWYCVPMWLNKAVFANIAEYISRHILF